MRIKTNLIILFFLLFLMIPVTVNAEEKVDYLADYEAVFYDNYDGLVSAEINTVEQYDAFIWVGTYSGLYRYDGYRFEEMDLDERICSVKALFCDSRDRLWIGTNDSGLGLYDSKTKEIKFYTVEDGLPADSIRAVCEGKDGKIYVGTVNGLSTINADGAVEDGSAYDDLNGIWSLSALPNGGVTGITYDGRVYYVKDNKVLAVESYPKEGLEYGAISRNIHGKVLAGSSGNEMEWLTFTDTGIVHGEIRDLVSLVVDKILSGVQAESREGIVLFAAAERKSRASVFVQLKVALKSHRRGARAQVRQGIVALWGSKRYVSAVDRYTVCQRRRGDKFVDGEIIRKALRSFHSESTVLFLY